MDDRGEKKSERTLRGRRQERRPRKRRSRIVVEGEEKNEKKDIKEECMKKATYCRFADICDKTRGNRTPPSPP